MARSRLCRACGEFHSTDGAWPEACYGHFGAKTEAGPQIIRDQIDPFRSMADGKMYDSKSRYRADLKARGMIEVGNERQERRPTPLPPVRETLRQTYEQLKSR